MSPLFQKLDSRSEGAYWAQARHPLACLVFLLPLLAIYEFGILYLGGADPSLLRNGADFWMRDWLGQAGLTDVLLLPALVAGGLLAWHVAGRYPWRISSETMLGMLAESILFALGLVLLGQIQDMAFARIGEPTWLAITSEESLARTVSFVGAGVYEEFLFRMCLLPLCYGVFRLLLLRPQWAIGLSIVATSVLFSGAHYIGEGGEPFALFSFTFRAIAGLFFAGLFVLRGFGITVGAHAAYDILVGVLLDASGS
ncbi:MAG: CPBP family intramembrane metalloprotease [Planctomycetaceae bacterium]|nr:CPBP family intramembrane metalloprotease [Planctomycetaceae bacterium]